MFKYLFSRQKTNAEVVGVTFDNESYLFNYQKKDNTIVYKTYLDKNSDLCFKVKVTLDKRIEQVDVRVAIFYNDLPISGRDLSVAIMSRQFNYYPHSLLTDKTIKEACVEVLSTVNRDVSFLDAIELAYETSLPQLDFLKTLVSNYESTLYETFSIIGNRYSQIEDKVFYQCDFISRISKTERNEAYLKKFSFFVFDRATYSFPDRGIQFHNPSSKKGNKRFELKEIDHEIFDQKMHAVCNYLNLNYSNINLISNMKHSSLFQVTLNFELENEPYPVFVYALVNYETKDIVVFDENSHYLNTYTDNSDLPDILCCLIINSAFTLYSLDVDVDIQEKITPSTIALIEMATI